ncbi:MAG TPA: MarR family transcriptional regulator [Verrucomicrobiae bacterium]|nr:MarR family transcriptional regulator [Verrucomicrobiae bacterium]
MDARENAGNVRYQATLQVLRTADTFWNISRTFFQRWDLSPSQFNVLNLLSSEPEGLSQTELSRQLIMHRSNITGLVDRLEKRGLVQRREVATDRRAYRVVLSSSGSKLLGQILPEYHRRAEGVWEGLSTQRLTALMNDLATATKHVTGNRDRL